MSGEYSLRKVTRIQGFVNLREGWSIRYTGYLRNKVKQGHDDDGIQSLLDPT